MRSVCIVTGGASGLGRELVAALSVDNRVIALDIDSDTLPIIANKFGCDHRLCDVSSYESVHDAVSYIADKYGRIDCLVNSAGLYLDGEITTNDSQKIRKIIEVNSLGPINLSKATIPYLRHQESGVIINIVSTAGLHPRAQCSVYHASKYALAGFGQSLALELEPLGIKVVNIYPDVMSTNFSRHAAIKRDFSHALDPGEVVKLVQFILALDSHTTLTDVTIKHI